MKKLFLKIFCIFWIAQSVIAIVSTVVILSHRAPDGGASVRSLREGLRVEAEDTLRLYRAGGCAAVAQFGSAHHQVISLLSLQGTNLCLATVLPAAYEEVPLGDGVFGHSFGERYIWRVSLGEDAAPAGSALIAVKRSSNGATLLHDIRDFGFPQLPLILAVGGATTFLLVLLVTRPLSLLSEGAKAIASGDLSVRIPERASWPQTGEDAFQALIHDFNGMADRLEGLVEAHKLLLRDVSHELRSPLTRLHVAVGLARNHTTAGATTHLDRVEQEADRVNDMIGQLLTLSSLEVLHPERRQLLSIRELIESLLPDARFEAAHKGCTVHFECESEFIVNGVSELLQRALENVVRNAIQHTCSRSEILISAHASDSAEAAVRVQVLDHGPGIPEEDVASIFQPFYRVDAARTSESGGFGVGLAIAKRAVDLHQGTIRAANRQHGGASITITLPIAI